MDGQMGLAAALRAMTPDDGRSRGEWAMFSALPDAPVHEAFSTRERFLDLIKRVLRRARTGRTAVSGDHAGRRAHQNHRPVSRPRQV